MAAHDKELAQNISCKIETPRIIINSVNYILNSLRGHPRQIRNPKSIYYNHVFVFGSVLVGIDNPSAHKLAYVSLSNATTGSINFDLPGGTHTGGLCRSMLVHATAGCLAVPICLGLASQNQYVMC
jgi:hypothetical protein